jgi:hypothetical protein
VLWLWGGPSHLDTFDMKPDAPLHQGLERAVVEEGRRAR